MLRFKAPVREGGFNQVVMSISRALLYSFGQIIRTPHFPHSIGFSGNVVIYDVYDNIF